MKRFFIALQFLTILPIRIKAEIKEKDFGRSLAYFPIVGLLLGLVLVSVLFAFNFLPGFVTAALMLTISVIITGGIHLDGFADTCDGLYAGKSKQEALKVMRDPHIGAVGAISVASLLILKFALFYGISLNFLWKIPVIMAVWGRYSQVLSCYLSGYARENGKAKYFIEYASKRELFFSTVFTLALSVSLMKVKGLIVSVLTLAMLLLIINYIKRRIGGMTGDTIGATSEITEMAVLFLALICANIPCF
ncbi:MAG: adenosylcobinamide-GDP ribazoletransferase [Candidatus Omnitrophota bacterium]|nr:MAG: adenosylcobinamide-GDP ribazoletransferase [Candidatus Omnitrophota bacterium]